jgi:lipopolysaccharide transport system permease protein
LRNRDRHAAASRITVIDRSGEGLWSSFAEYRNSGTLFLLLALRDIRLRYRETAFGAGWAILQPLLPMIIFGAVFSRLKVETGGIPYPLFVFSGFALWLYISNCVTAASPVFLNNSVMINKIYFPRAVLPLAICAALVLDGSVAAAATLALSLWYGFQPVWTWLLLPFAGMGAVIVAMAAALAAASLSAAWRDLKNAVPSLVQMWMYASPVLYPVEWIPNPIRRLAGLNPVTGVLEAFRSCLFHTAPRWDLIAQTGASLALLLCAAVGLFRYFQADLAERL